MLKCCLYFSFSNCKLVLSEFWGINALRLFIWLDINFSNIPIVCMHFGQMHTQIFDEVKELLCLTYNFSLPINDNENEENLPCYSILLE